MHKQKSKTKTTRTQLLKIRVILKIIRTITVLLKQRNSHTKTKRLFRRKTLIIHNDNKHLPVGGRLMNFHTQWQTSTLWRTIRYGITWTWKSIPTGKPGHSLHQPTSIDMDREVMKMHKKRTIQKTRFLIFTSRLFSVPKKDSGENRVILDLSKLNEFIKIKTFKMLTLKQVRLLLPEGAWTASLDLKDGFYHLMVSKKFRPYLGFRYKGQNWRFRAMPFGLNTALLLTNVMSFSILCLSKADIWALPYLDNILIIARTRLECIQKVQK